MFDSWRRARADLATMNALLPAAERIARDDGVDLPGAEHLLLAALDLPDQLAGQALRTFHVDASQLRAAMLEQHREALRSIGVIADDNAIDAVLPSADQPTGLYRSQGSLQTTFRRAATLAKGDGSAMNSGYLLLAATEAEHGTVARSLEHLGVDRLLLRSRTSELLAG